jgi:hypothetical protein
MRLQTPVLSALIALAVLPVGASASQAIGAGGAVVRPAPKSSWDADRKNPYSKLFKPVLLPVAPAPSAAGPEIKCGMTIIPVDPSIDPRMVMPPLPSTTKYAIRAIDPPLCR